MQFGGLTGNDFAMLSSNATLSNVNCLEQSAIMANPQSSTPHRSTVIEKDTVCYPKQTGKVEDLRIWHWNINGLRAVMRK